MSTDKTADVRGSSLESRRFQLLIENIKDYAIYMLTPEGIVDSWNPGARNFKGYTAEEIIGQPFSRFYTPEDQLLELPARNLQIAATEGKFEGEGWRVRKDGSRFWANVVIDPVHDETGKMIGFAKVTRDITEQRKAAAMLEETRAALAQSQKMEAIGKLTGGIAHDFNNLLQGIMGNLDLIRVRLATNQISQIGPHLDAAIANTKRSAALTHRLLAFARRQTLQPKPVDATWLVNSMTDLIVRTLGPDVELVSDLQQDLWWTLCDRHQLENALINLVINSRTAMPNGGKLTIHTRNLPADEAAAIPGSKMSPGDHVILSVSDVGTGMTPEVLSHVFEPFFTTKAIGEGTGLGLSMVHGFMAQSNGHVRIDSKVGEGTTVSLYFPRHVVTAIETVTAEQEPPAAPDNEKPNILVVDDEYTVRTMLEEVFQHVGYPVMSAYDAQEGLQVLQDNQQIDLLVTDVGLPGGMNGRQLATQARQLRPELKILFITGYSEQSVISKGTLPEGMDMLLKPFTMETIVAKVRAMAGS